MTRAIIEMNSPMLSLIVVHYKSPDMLERCIESLYRTIRKTPFEIIAVGSASDGTAEKMLAQRFPDVRCISFSRNIGYPKAVNAGIAKAQGDQLFILNHDIVATDGAIDEMARFLANEGAKARIGMLGPKLLDMRGQYQYSAFRFYTPFTIVARRTPLGKLPQGKRETERFLLKDKKIETAKAPQQADWLMGSALLVSRQALNKVGLMDERFFMYFEDVDWARRFWENNYSVVYFPQAVLHHVHGKASDVLGIFDVLFNRMTWIHLKSAAQYFWKYKGKTDHYI